MTTPIKPKRYWDPHGYNDHFPDPPSQFTWANLVGGSWGCEYSSGNSPEESAWLSSDPSPSDYTHYRAVESASAAGRAEDVAFAYDESHSSTGQGLKKWRCTIL